MIAAGRAARSGKFLEERFHGFLRPQVLLVHIVDHCVIGVTSETEALSSVRPDQNHAAGGQAAVLRKLHFGRARPAI